MKDEILEEDSLDEILEEDSLDDFDQILLENYQIQNYYKIIEELQEKATPNTGVEEIKELLAFKIQNKNSNIQDFFDFSNLNEYEDIVIKFKEDVRILEHILAIFVSKRSKNIYDSLLLFAPSSLNVQEKFLIKKFDFKKNNINNKIIACSLNINRNMKEIKTLTKQKINVISNFLLFLFSGCKYNKNKTIMNEIAQKKIENKSLDRKIFELNKLDMKLNETFKKNFDNFDKNFRKKINKLSELERNLPNTNTNRSQNHHTV